MKDGVTIKHGYSLNLDTVQVGMTLGMMRHSDGSLHFYLDGVDQGEACSHIPDGVYPVIDLYGQCVQVSFISYFHVCPSHIITSNTENIGFNCELNGANTCYLQQRKLG